MAFIQMEDNASNTAEVILFPKTFKNVEQWLGTYHVFVVRGRLDMTFQQKCKIKANEMVPIELFFQEWQEIQKVTCLLPHLLEESMVQMLKDLCPKGSIPLEFVFHENGKILVLRSKTGIMLDHQIIQTIEQQNITVKLSL